MEIKIKNRRLSVEDGGDEEEIKVQQICANL